MTTEQQHQKWLANPLLYMREITEAQREMHAGGDTIRLRESKTPSKPSTPSVEETDRRCSEAMRELAATLGITSDVGIKVFAEGRKYFDRPQTVKEGAVGSGAEIELAEIADAFGFGEVGRKVFVTGRVA